MLSFGSGDFQAYPVFRTLDPATYKYKSGNLHFTPESEMWEVSSIL